jgi:primary-amine oxidase
MPQTAVFRYCARVLSTLVFSTWLCPAEPLRHPLDALTAKEYWSVYETLQASGHVTSATRYAGVNIHEPPKQEVLRWKPGEPFRREALAIVKQGRQTFEALVDVANQKLLSWKEIKGVEPVLIGDDEEGVEEAVRANPEFQAAMRKRGITDLELVGCGGDSPGYFGTPEEQGRRLLRVTCHLGLKTSNNGAHPIEGVVVVWDSEQKKALRVIDTGVVPVPQGNSDYDAESLGQPREVPGPISILQPAGHGFRLDGHQVSWQNWKFHFRVDPRMGVVVTNVTYADGGKDRSVMYEGSLSEIFVPYMDPSEGWYYKTFIDAGEGNVAGDMASTLEAGVDCPENSVYFDAVFANHRGVPQVRTQTACLFERASTEPMWRHNRGPGQVESRRRRDLVLRMIAKFGNYDYAVDWAFMQDGSIRIGVGATGTVEVKAVRSRTAAEDRDARDGRYGHFVTENTVGVNHDHFFSFRLDLDVDGTNNSFLRDQLEPERLPADHPRKSVWVSQSKIAKVEEDAQLQMMMEHPALWRVINPGVSGPLGYPVSYEIKPGHNGISLMAPDDYPRRRAGFINHHIWVTPYQEGELHAAGDYPTQSKGGDGLPAWTKGNRPIENTDIVVWYTLGFHHVPRPEDWPVMPVSWHEFELRPFDFFRRNPAMDLPK